LKTSFGRIFCSAKNRALRGFRRLRGRYAPLQSLARIPIPQGVNIVTLINNLVTDFALISFRATLIKSTLIGDLLILLRKHRIKAALAMLAHSRLN
jgi:hypothetical protein